MELRIKEILKERGIAIKDFTLMMELTAPSVSNFINGKSKPSIDVFERAAKVLNVPFTELFERESKTEVTALVEYKKEFYKAETLQELKTIVSKIETAEKE